MTGPSSSSSAPPARAAPVRRATPAACGGSVSVLTTGSLSVHPADARRSSGTGAVPWRGDRRPIRFRSGLRRFGRARRVPRRQPHGGRPLGRVLPRPGGRERGPQRRHDRRRAGPARRGRAAAALRRRGDGRHERLRPPRHGGAGRPRHREHPLDAAPRAARRPDRRRVGAAAGARAGRVDPAGQHPRAAVRAEREGRVRRPLARLRRGGRRAGPGVLRGPRARERGRLPAWADAVRPHLAA